MNDVTIIHVLGSICQSYVAVLLVSSFLGFALSQNEHDDLPNDVQLESNEFVFQILLVKNVVSHIVASWFVLLDGILEAASSINVEEHFLEHH